MPRILALRPGSIVGGDLGHVAFRITLGATTYGEHPCFALQYEYAPATSALYRPVDSQYHQLPFDALSLVRVPISLAENQEEVARIASVATGSGSDEIDAKRLAEAFELMKNRARSVAQEQLTACVRDAGEVVKAYNAVRAWIGGGMLKLATIPVVTSYAQKEGQSLETTLVCQP